MQTRSAGRKHKSARTIKMKLKMTFVTGETRVYFSAASCFLFAIVRFSFPPDQNRPALGSIFFTTLFATTMVMQPNTDCSSEAAEERLMFGFSSSAL